MSDKILQNENLGFAIHDLARMMRRNFDHKAQNIGLTRSQWSVLVHLYRNDGVQQKMLADQMDITPITLSGLLDRLERDGWVERKVDGSDRRAKKVFLTAKVAPVLKDIQRLGKELRKELLQGISEKEFEYLMQLLLKMRSNLSSK
jgi:DNA-binding MarR family transcriptional regulator